MLFSGVLLLLAFVNNVLSLNILAIISLPLRSHYMAFKPLFRELALRGHQVTVINNFPEDDAPANLTFIDVRSNVPVNDTSRIDYFETIPASFMHLGNIYSTITLSPDEVKGDCEALFESESCRKHLAEGHKYDVIFVEQFVSDCALVYAAAMYDAPIIGITSHVLLPPTYNKLGIPFDFSVDPFYFSNCGLYSTLYHKLESAFLHIYFNTIGKWTLEKNIYDVFKRHLPYKTLDIDQIGRDRMKMVFAYQHFSVTGARLLAPQLLEIGGMHIGKHKPLPKNVEYFLNSAKHGVIYVSFGSNLKSSTMSHRKLQQFLDAFKNIPQKVLWKWENSSFPDDTENVYTQSWLPQLDILCHPKVLAFVSHGGMLSMSEAAHCGKPVLAIPFFGDQFGNAAMLQVSGLGSRLFLSDLNANNLAAEIKHLTSHKIQLNAQRISKLWHDRPHSALHSAVYWTEYVARHSLAPPSLPSRHKTWLECLHLDVIGVLFFMLLVSYLFIYLCLKLTVKLLRFIYSIEKNKID